MKSRLFSHPLTSAEFTEKFKSHQNDPSMLRHLLAAQSADFLARKEIRGLLLAEFARIVNSATETDFNFAKFDILVNYMDLKAYFSYQTRRPSILGEDALHPFWIMGNALHCVIDQYAKAMSDHEGRNGYSRSSELGYQDRVNRNFDLMLVRLLMEPALDKECVGFAQDAKPNGAPLQWPGQKKTPLQLAESWGLGKVTQLLQHWMANEAAGKRSTPGY